MLNQGAIVLIPVPFTDLSARKRRPVVVISNDAYNQRSPASQAHIWQLSGGYNSGVRKAKGVFL